MKMKLSMASPSKIFRIAKADIIGIPFRGLLGQAFDHAYTLGLEHKSGAIVDILFDRNDEAIDKENALTDRIKKAFTVKDQVPEIAKCLIDDIPCLAIKLPIIY